MKSNDPKSTVAQISGHSDNSKGLTPTEFNDAPSVRQIVYDGNTLYYALHEHEFELLKRGYKNLWKDVCIGSLFAFLPLLGNTFLTIINLPVPKEGQSFNGELFINSVLAAVTLIIAILSGIIWKRLSTNIDDLINRIKERQKFRI